MHETLHALVICAIRPGPQLARDAPIAVFREIPLDPNNGRTKVGIGPDEMLVAGKAMSPILQVELNSELSQLPL